MNGKEKHWFATGTARGVSLEKTNGKEKNWFVTPPHSPSKATAAEVAMGAEPDKESFRRSFVEMASVGARYADEDGREEDAVVGKGERRGSEAKGWDEIRARRAAVGEKNRDANARRSVFVEGDTGGEGEGVNRYPSTSTHAMKSPHPIDDLKSPATIASSGGSKSPKEKSGFLPKFMKIGQGRKSGEVREAETRERVERYMNVGAGAKEGDERREKDKDTRERVRELMARTHNGKDANEKDLGEKPFDADTSDYEDAHTEIRNASRASLVRPTVVQHQGSTSSGNGLRPMGLKEMLLSEAPAAAAVSPGPSSAKLRSFLGEDIDFKSKREGIVSNTSAQGSTNDVTALSPKMSGALNSPSVEDALRSHPLVVVEGPEGGVVKEKGEEKKKKPKATRKVTFPPPDVDIGYPGERSEIRQSIVSTPYPKGYVWSEKEKEEHKKSGNGKKKEKEENEGYETAKEGDEGDEEEKDVLTLVIYSPNSRIPKVKEVVIPTSKEKTLVDDGGDEKKPATVATMKKDFDDEKLFKFLRSEYTKLRGKGHFGSARVLRNMGIIHYKNIAELRRRDENSPHSQRFSAEKDELVADGLLAHFQEPKLGRKNTRWVEWIGKLPGNSGSTSKTRQRIAVEFSHGWSLARTVCAVLGVLVLGLAAAVLWMIFGMDGVKEGKEDIGSVVGPVAVKHAAIHGVGGRVAGGVGIGVLVMLVGWMGVGVWVLGSWLRN